MSILISSFSLGGAWHPLKLRKVSFLYWLTSAGEVGWGVVAGKIIFLSSNGSAGILLLLLLFLGSQVIESSFITRVIFFATFSYEFLFSFYTYYWHDGYIQNTWKEIIQDYPLKMIFLLFLLYIQISLIFLIFFDINKGLSLTFLFSKYNKHYKIVLP